MDTESTKILINKTWLCQQTNTKLFLPVSCMWLSFYSTILSDNLKLILE